MPDVEVPDDLPVILRNFTLSVLRTKPTNIVDYAVDYFLDLQGQERRSTVKRLSKTTTTTTTTKKCHFSSQAEHAITSVSPLVELEQKEKRSSSMFNENSTMDENLHDPTMTIPNITIHCISPASSSTDDEQTDSNEENDVLPEHETTRRHYVKKHDFRRVSVAAERYNPEEDDDDDEEDCRTYPKTTEQRQRLKDAVSHNLLFRTLETKQIDQILDAMWEKHVKQGEHIIRQGDDGDHFYIIDQGHYSVYVSKDSKSSPMKIADYHQTGSFGELALMYNQPRSATIIAESDGILWVMGRQTFRKLVLKHAFRKRRLYENFLRDLNILQSLTDYERSNVADAIIPINAHQNDIIIKQGDHGDRMFFIEDGQCDVYMNGKFHNRLVKGDYFGELALLNHEPRSATVIAASAKVRLASLEVQSFERLLGPCLNLMQRQTSKYFK